MNKLFKIGLLSISLMTVLGTSIHAAPTATTTPQSTYTMAAKIQNITLGIGQSYKVNKNYSYHKNENPRVAIVTMGYIDARGTGTTIIRFYDKNDNEVAAYRVTVKNIV
ncbi:hypothetical protein ABD76_27350 [Paenibacillus dendritiformis]|uniref:hypothetical protein n=1 Tax=Paenibacillus dendritiformis TaxID=130049 RepID=UPI0018CF0FAC|nr:hypothetical protein [Paenibacillus dendritiformis]MBG9795957.1 hypothetical protein [Paenibacillus dendritiformis]